MAGRVRAAQSTMRSRRSRHREASRDLGQARAALGTRAGGTGRRGGGTGAWRRGARVLASWRRRCGLPLFDPVLLKNLE
jgi:hypothetical protein